MTFITCCTQINQILNTSTLTFLGLKKVQYWIFLNFRDVEYHIHTNHFLIIKSVYNRNKFQTASSNIQCRGGIRGGQRL